MNGCPAFNEETESLRVDLIEKTEEQPRLDNKNVKIESITTDKYENSDKDQIKFENVIVQPGNVANNDLKYDFGLKNLPEEYKDSYATYIKEVKAIATIPITKSISDEYIRNFKLFNLRYYEDKYCIKFGVSEDGYCDINIRIHTNKLMLIALASGNDIIRNSKPIVYITFVINCNDRSNVCLSGKKKKGSKAVEPGTILCQVKCQDDDKLYNIRSGVSGRIIEINERIKSQPDLLRTDPKGVGFIAVLAPKGKEPAVPKNLLSEEEYLHHLTRRLPKCLLNSEPSTSTAGT